MIHTIISRFFAIAFLLLASISLSAKKVSPLQYGLLDAKTGQERYEVLLKTHTDARDRCLGVSYKGIGRIQLEIPKSAKGIPLSDYTDFAGVEFVVENNAKKMTLFVMSSDVQDIEISKEQLESGYFRDIKDLRRGKSILIIEDKTPWVANRNGYNYGAIRKDILLLKNGKAQNRTVASYANETSLPSTKFRKVQRRQIVIKNLTFTRTKDSKQMTMLLGIENQDNVLIQDVTVNTPEGTDLYGDCCIGVNNSTNVRMEDVTINGTYSRGDKFGYGIGMNNVWDVHFKRLEAKSAWGIFGNNNVNHAVLEDSDINRFDIHCYGRDVYCYGTTFRDMCNQFSSMYGELVYDGCTFLNFIPVLFENSYSAYTPFDLKMKNCKIEAKENNPCLILTGYMTSPNDSVRSELKDVSLPNILLENIVVSLKNDIQDWNLFYMNTVPSSSVNYIHNVTATGLKVMTETGVPATVSFANRAFKTVEDINFFVKDSSIETIIR